MKINRKSIMILGMFLVIGTASAAIVGGLFTHTTNATVEEAIIIDNCEEWISMYSGETHVSEIAITNRANVAIPGELRTTGNDLIGLTTTYKLNGVLLEDADNDGKPEITIPADSTVTLKKFISADIALESGEYNIITEMKPAN